MWLIEWFKGKKRLTKVCRDKGAKKDDIVEWHDPEMDGEGSVLSIPFAYVDRLRPLFGYSASAWAGLEGAVKIPSWVYPKDVVILSEKAKVNNVVSDWIRDIQPVWHLYTAQSGNPLVTLPSDAKLYLHTHPQGLHQYPQTGLWLTHDKRNFSVPRDIFYTLFQLHSGIMADKLLMIVAAVKDGRQFDLVTGLPQDPELPSWLRVGEGRKLPKNRAAFAVSIKDPINRNNPVLHRTCQQVWIDVDTLLVNENDSINGQYIAELVLKHVVATASKGTTVEVDTRKFLLYDNKQVDYPSNPIGHGDVRIQHVTNHIVSTQEVGN